MLISNPLRALARQTGRPVITPVTERPPAPPGTSVGRIEVDGMIKTAGQLGLTPFASFYLAAADEVPD